MKDTVTLRLIHPYREERVLTLELPRTTRFSELTPLLYEKEFVEFQKGGFRFLIRGHLCTTTHPIGDYIPDCADGAEVKVYPYAQIMV